MTPDHSASFLESLQQQALQYFLDNQTSSGLVLDRQANHGPLRPLTQGWCSTSATGMGLFAIALASAEPYFLLSPAEAIRRIGATLETALERLPCEHGMTAHFIDVHTGQPVGHDVFSTVDSSWLLAGGLWSAEFLHDAHLERLATQLYERVDWAWWAAPDGPNKGLIRHGKRADGRFLDVCWDRLDGETIFMYVLATGAEAGNALAPGCWSAMRAFDGTVAGLHFNNADLGLFAFEYGLELTDPHHWRPPGGVDLAAEARLATRANRLFCQQHATQFTTYRSFWGLSDGDGPGDTPETSVYRPYGPGSPIDGTAHLIATLAAVAYDPDEVLDNLQRADRDTDPGVRGRYGFSNVNLDRHWFAGDMVGIDVGAAVLALDNYLMANRVRDCFHRLPCVARGLQRSGFIKVSPV